MEGTTSEINLSQFLNTLLLISFSDLNQMFYSIFQLSLYLYPKMSSVSNPFYKKKSQIL